MKEKIAFICNRNACRSQIAEALGRRLRGSEFDFYSAGLHAGESIDPNAVRIMRELYDIDMEAEQRSKGIDEIPAPDRAISMGCDGACPFIGRAFDDDWKLPDPTGKSNEAYRAVIQSIEAHICAL